MSIRDTKEYAIQYKLDIGVHTIETARQNDMEFDLTRVFMDRGFMAMLANPRMNWLKLSPQEATEKLVAFMRNLA